MAAIYKRELKSYFNSMTGYLFIALFTAFMGIYFMAYNLYSGYPYFSYVLNSTMTILLIAVPILTMKSFAEDRKTKTDQLLLTAPVSVTKIVLGKYLAMVTVFFIPVLISSLCPLIIKANGEAYLLSDYASIIAFFMLGCIFIAIGMFSSALTESQVIAAVGTFAILFVLCLWRDLLSFLPSSEMWTAVRNVLSKIDIRNAFDNFAYNNIFDVTGLFFYLSMSFVFIFLTVQALLKRRWS